jgi:hypothetical protein
MQISRLIWISWTILFGCSTDPANTDGGTVGTEAAGGPSGQPQVGMSLIPRSICVTMCDYALSCGEIDAGQLGNCMFSCDGMAGWLDEVDPNAAVDLAGIAACYMASSCAADGPPKCQPSEIAELARTFDPEESWQVTWPLAGYTTIGATSCMEESESFDSTPEAWKVSCQSFIKPRSNPDMIWGLTCDRPETASAWTCSCWEHGVEVQSQVRGEIRPTDPGMLRICWSADRLACFYAGDLDC